MNISRIVSKLSPNTYMYSPLIGSVRLLSVNKDAIIVEDGHYNEYVFNEEGILMGHGCESSGMALFPSEEIRDWNKFNFPEYNFKTFDKVLMRKSIDTIWVPRFFYNSGKNEFGDNSMYWGMNDDTTHYAFCIPYEGNEHLEFTKDLPNNV